MRPPALLGKKRAEALAEMAKGRSAKSVAKQFGVSDKTLTKLVRDTIGGKGPAKSSGQAKRTPRSPKTKVRAPDEEIDLASLLDDDIRLRVQIRDTLKADFDTAEDTRERTIVAKELGACLDGLRKAVAIATAPRAEEGEDDESGAFDAYMMQIVAKARVVVNAESGLPSQEKQAGEVGDRARADGTDG